MYRLFLFDLDDTLLDFRESERRSLRLTLGEIGIQDRYDQFYPIYRAVSGELWKQLEEGQIDQNFLKPERFRRTFETIGVKFDPSLANTIYLGNLVKTAVEIDGAESVCRELQRFGEIGVITNGLIETQARRIASSALAPYISFVAVSEKCGFAKPDARFFAYSVAMAKPVDKSQILLIGDRPDADIRGAMNFGIDACYYNPFNQPLTKDLRAKYEIRKLTELLELDLTH